MATTMVVLYERYLRFGGNGRFLLHMALIGGFLTKDSYGKLCIVQTTATILVIRVEERAKLVLWEVHATLFEDSTELGKIDSSRVHDVKVLEHLH